MKIIYSEKNDSIRKYFSIMINQWKDCSIIFECASIFDLVDNFSQPELSAFVLFGLDSPIKADLLGISLITTQFPLLKIIGISQEINASNIQMVTAFGVSSYLSIEDSETFFQNTFKTILKKGYCSNKYAKEKYFRDKLLPDINDPVIKGNAGEISDAEKKVLKLIPTGLTYDQIADELHLSIKTVHTHREHLFKKFTVCSRQELTVIAIETGLFKKAAGSICQ